MTVRQRPVELGKMTGAADRDRYRGSRKVTRSRFPGVKQLLRQHAGPALRERAREPTKS